ncbi:MAG: hypothetical protein MUF51_11410 [Vicinamibacteria bacterium]|jgi:stage II sporulation protein D|nr:hypothetical protein [Vicinamibacteria bacterium]
MISAALLAVTVEVLTRHAPVTLIARTGGDTIRLEARSARRFTGTDVEVELPSGLRRRYPGRLEIAADGRRLRIYNVVDDESYVAGVVAGEAETRAPAALEALAIAARSMIACLQSRHAQGRVCDLTHCQVYIGVTDDASILSAVRRSGARRLFYRGAPAVAPYHSTCGGHTRLTPGFFDIRASYLAGVGDGDLCRPSPHFRWEALLTSEQMRALFGSDPQATHAYDPAQIYRRSGALFGWNVIKSPFFQVARHPGGVIVSGRGLGHGIGMCLWGAEALARQGRSADEILSFYYPGTKVRP